MLALSERLLRVRITCGSWERVCQPSVTRSGAGGDGSRAVFLDPPYATSGDLYAHTEDGIAERVREWCLRADRSLRVVLCGYDNEHDALLDRGWRVTAGKAGGGAGYSTRKDNGRRERLWISPACLADHEQADLFAEHGETA
jgi:16S rRNA G966 N2-methylase RsmD